MPEAVIGRLFLRVLQDLIGFGDFLEFVVGRLVARIGVWMKLLGELAIGAFQLLLVGALVDAQNFIIVALGHADPSAQLYLACPETSPSPHVLRGEKAFQPDVGHSLRPISWSRRL